jgi:glycosyltransferase involved in cell wall biosynthesis
MAKRTFLHVFPTFAVGGAQTRFAAIANHLGPSVRHIVVPIDGQTTAREKLNPGLDVTFLPPPRVGAIGVRSSITQARAVLRETRPHMLITSNWGSIDWVIAKLTMPLFPSLLPHLHMEDGFGPEEQDRQLPRRVLTRRLVLRRSDVMLPSQTLIRIATDTWKLPPRNLHYIPNGVDIERFARAVPMELPPGEGPVIGTIAALRPEKNVLRLVDAFALLRARRPARLVIVGDGPRRPILEARVAELGLGASVLFAGHSQDADRWMAAFDVFALSSDTEQMPLSLLEAMAASRPAVATEVGDVRSMLAPENLPYLVPRDPAALAVALARMLDNPAEAAIIGAANGRRARDTFSEQSMFDQFRRIMRVW